MQKIRTLHALALVAFFTACTSDRLPNNADPACEDTNYTYHEVKLIVNAGCATAGCHGDESTTGVYTSYTDMKAHLDDGSIHKRVFEIGDMPPLGSPVLTQDELQILKCWIVDGYPEG